MNRILPPSIGYKEVEVNLNEKLFCDMCKTNLKNSGNYNAKYCIDCLYKISSEKNIIYGIKRKLEFLYKKKGI